MALQISDKGGDIPYDYLILNYNIILDMILYR